MNNHLLYLVNYLHLDNRFGNLITSRSYYSCNLESWQLDKKAIRCEIVVNDWLRRWVLINIDGAHACYGAHAWLCSTSFYTIVWLMNYRYTFVRRRMTGRKPKQRSMKLQMIGAKLINCFLSWLLFKFDCNVNFLIACVLEICVVKAYPTWLRHNRETQWPIQWLSYHAMISSMYDVLFCITSF